MKTGMCECEVIDASLTPTIRVEWFLVEEFVLGIVETCVFGGLYKWAVFCPVSIFVLVGREGTLEQALTHGWNGSADWHFSGEGVLKRYVDIVKGENDSGYAINDNSYYIEYWRPQWFWHAYLLEFLLHFSHHLDSRDSCNLQMRSYDSNF